MSCQVELLDDLQLCILAHALLLFSLARSYQLLDNLLSFLLLVYLLLNLGLELLLELLQLEGSGQTLVDVFVLLGLKFSLVQFQARFIVLDHLPQVFWRGLT